MQISNIEQKSRALDEMRSVRIIRDGDVDFNKYITAESHAEQVKPASHWLKEILDEFKSPTKETFQTMPWEKTKSTFQFRPGEVTLYAGSNGGGKSLITGQIALGLMKQHQKICIASFEMKPKRTLGRMLRQFCGQNFEEPHMMSKVSFIEKIVGRFEAYADNKIWLYDQQGTVNTKQVIAVARYCAVELGIQHIFIDSLMKCVSAEDDYNAQKYFVDELTALARDHNVHIHLIHHIRKLASDEVTPNKNDIKGSGSISDQVDNVLLMWRNKKKEHQLQTGGAVDYLTPDAYLMCEKQRNGEAEEWYSLWYQRESQQFVDAHDATTMAFDHGGSF